MSSYGTAAQKVARRARSQQREHRQRHHIEDSDSDGSVMSDPSRGSRASPRQPRASSVPPNTRAKSPNLSQQRSGSPNHVDAGSKVYSSSVPNGAEVSPWQLSTPSPHTSGRTSPVANHPITQPAALTTLRPRSPRSLPSQPHVHKQPGRSKSDYLAYLGVHMDHEDSHTYRPGETIYGKIVLKLRHRALIVGLDFRLKGKVDVLLHAGHQPHKDSETFLYHCHRMIGVWDQRATQLEPGSYVSHFKYILPNNLPSSATKFSNHCQLRVVYGIQAILTDINKDTKQVSKMFVVHAPPLQLSHAPAYRSETIDDQTVHFTVHSTNLITGQACFITIESQLNISHIAAHVEQTMKTGPHTLCEILTKIRTKSRKHQGGTGNVLRITIPESAVMDLKRYTRTLDIQQSLHVKIKHKDTWVHFSVPIKIYPSSSQYRDEVSSWDRKKRDNKDDGMPVFDRVRRYSAVEYNKSANSLAPVKVNVDYETETWLDKFSGLFKTD